MKYLKANFYITPVSQPARDVVATLAGEAGFESFEETDFGMTGYVQAELFDKSKLDEDLLNLPFPDTKVKYDIQEMEDKDWNEEWEREGFEPIHIGKRVVIEDARKGEAAPATADDGLLHIQIDARKAFGSGTHATTQMMVEALLDMNLKGKRVLDCGCGTGILGIVAAKRGASGVVSFDVDDWCVRNTAHNAMLNDVDIEALEGGSEVLSHVSGLFDVVLANINRNILLADMPRYVDVMSLPSYLLLSGFYESDVELLLKKASELGLEEVTKKQNGDWRCLVLARH